MFTQQVVETLPKCPQLSYSSAISQPRRALSDSPSRTSTAKSLQFFLLFLLLSRLPAPRLLSVACRAQGLIIYQDKIHQSLWEGGG